MQVAQINKILITILLMGPLIVMGQKLPKVQKTSLYAPRDIKVDGKANEWNQLFQAYHPNNRIFYTVCNDADNFYLTIRAVEAIAIKKLIVDGTTLTLINNKERKTRDGEERMEVTFPFMTVTYTGMESAAYDYETLMEDSLANKDKLVSLANTTNRKALATFQKVMVKGINEIRDSVITLQNSYGIKAMAQFSSKMEFTYELAIPLKYLGLNGSSVISYNIRLNGVPSVEKTAAGQMAQPIVTSEGHDGRVDYDQEYLNQPTDFWGVYTLAKKL
jgi:hypothetical protein